MARKKGEICKVINVRWKNEQQMRTCAWFLMACEDLGRDRAFVVAELMEGFNKKHGYAENGKGDAR